ncbi:MAG: hypothetical protein LBM99_05525 [Bacillales bacterium]|jgi:hypothetical protein|nr:hypothetical protein [Bacillales bacterium]
MEWIKKNVFKIIAVIIALVGFPIGNAMVLSWYQPKLVIIGVALSFILLGLFIFFIDPKIKKGRRIVSIIILVLGIGASFLIGYRGGSLGSPWIWDHRGYPAVVVDPWIEWHDTIFTFVLFPLLSLTLWIKKDVFKSLAINVAVIGVSLGIGMVHLGYRLRYAVIGVVLGFILLGLFIYFVDPKIKKGRRIVSIVILVLGIISSLLIGYRDAGLGSPWFWIYEDYIERFANPRIEWVDMIVPFIIFLLLSLTLWLYDNKITKSMQENKNITDNNYPLEIIGISVALIGFSIGVVIVKYWYIPNFINFGVALGFILLGLFIYFIDQKIKKGRRIVSVIILLLGIVSSLSIGFRYNNFSSPWIWNNRVDIWPIYKPWIEWVDTIIPFIIFPLLSVFLWFYDYKIKKLEKKNYQKEEEKHEELY